jgi:plastocyanin
MRVSTKVVVATILATWFTTGMDQKAAAGNVTVHIKKNPASVPVFDPETVEINVGDTVTWVNDDDEGHTATRTTAPTFDTGLLQPNESKALQFTTVSPTSGFDYFCVPHPFMTGHVVVRSPGVHTIKMKTMEDKTGTVRQPTTVEVHMKPGFKYEPESVEIQVGDTVKWVNDDEDPHTATRTDPVERFDTSLLAKGKFASHTFTTVSDGMGFEYFCVPHPFMKGRVVVKLPGSHLANGKHDAK